MPALPGTDGAGTPSPFAEGAAATRGDDRVGRCGEDRLPGDADRHALSAGITIYSSWHACVFSVSLQQLTISLANCEFPDKTPNEPDRWNWIHCQVRSSNKRNPSELIMPDLSGEAILEEVDHPHTYPVIGAFLSKCSGIMLLIDAVRLMEGGKDQDFFAMKMLSYLSELDDDHKSGWCRRPISMIFTKADQCEVCFDDPGEFARKH